MSRRRSRHEEPLPPYRFGIDPGPHPTRDPRGHSFGAEEPPDRASAVARGALLFDHGYYWEAHEAWEGPWRQLPAGDPTRSFLQALIQAAAVWLKRVQGKTSSAERLRERAAAHLAAARTGGVSAVEAVTVDAVERALLARSAPRLTER